MKKKIRITNSSDSQHDTINGIQMFCKHIIIIILYCVTIAVRKMRLSSDLEPPNNNIRRSRAARRVYEFETVRKSSTANLRDISTKCLCVFVPLRQLRQWRQWLWSSAHPHASRVIYLSKEQSIDWLVFLFGRQMVRVCAQARAWAIGVGNERGWGDAIN